MELLLNLFLMFENRQITSNGICNVLEMIFIASVEACKMQSIIIIRSHPLITCACYN